MYNKSILIGRMVADPDLKTTPNGVYVTSFRIAVDRAASKERKADFITIVAWRSSAEFVCKFFRKGKPIGVEGQIQTREYTDRDDRKRTAFEVVADRVFFVGGKDDAQPSGENPDPTPAPEQRNAPDVSAPASSGSASIGDDDDDLPF